METKPPLSKRKAKRQIKVKDNNIEGVSSPETKEPKTPKRRGIKFYLFIVAMLVFNGFTYSYWLSNIFDDDAPKTSNTQAKNLPSPNKKAKNELPPDWDLPPQNAPIDRGYNASSGQFPPGALPPDVSLPGITSYNPTMPGRTMQQGYGANDGIRQNFTGQIRDTESNLLYYGARYYNPQHGRFTSVDPENAGANPEDPQSWNGYAYARNNPLLYTDPDGLEYRVCNQEGQCWTHDDKQIQKAKGTGEFDWEGSKNPKTGLDSGILYDSEGNQAGTYQQTSHDNAVQAMVWGAAPTLDIFTPIIELVQPAPVPGGGVIGGIFKVGKAAKAVNNTRRAIQGFRIIERAGGTIHIAITTAKGEVEVVAHMVKEGNTLVLKKLDVLGSGANSLGVRELRQLEREFVQEVGKREGVKEVIIEGGRRESGANPGKIPRPRTYKID